MSLDEIDFGVQEERRASVSSEYGYLKNHQLIEPDALHFIRELDYSRLMSNVTGELLACFFQKFAGVEEICTEAAVEDVRHFRWFLKSVDSYARTSQKPPDSYLFIFSHTRKTF